jgi:hypothetical protein
MSTIQRALYCNLCAKYSAYSPDYAMWTVVPDIYNVITAPHIQASIFNSIYLRCCWRYLDNALRVPLQTLCQIQRSSCRWRYVNCGPGHVQCNYSSTYSDFERICATIADISRMLRAIYCKPGAKCSAHPPVYDTWTEVPDICNVITAPHIQTSVFNWTYLHC